MLAVEQLLKANPETSEPEAPTPDKATRTRLRDLVWPEEGGERKAYDPRFIREFKSSPGLLLSQLVFWSGKGHDPDGWIYKTKTDIEREVGLTEHQTDHSRKLLQKQGIIEAEKRPRCDRAGRVLHPSPVWHYRVDLAALAKRLDLEDPTVNHDSKPGEMPGSSREKCLSRGPESPQDEPRKAPASYTESTYRENIPETFRDTSLQEGERVPQLVNGRNVFDTSTESIVGTLDTTAYEPTKPQAVDEADVGAADSKDTSPHYDPAPTGSPAIDNRELQEVDNRELQEVWKCLDDPATDAGKARLRYKGGTLDVEEVAVVVCRERNTQMGRSLDVSRYLRTVQRLLEQMAIEEGEVA